jgi:hypothetical protein
MPRTSSAPSSSLSSCCSFDSEHVPHQYINLKDCMNILQRREDIATTIRLTNNDRTAYTDILLLDHLFQAIQQTKERLQWEKQCARYRIIRLLSRKLLDRLHAWIVNTNLNVSSQLPVGSPSIPLETHTPSTISHSSHSAEPKPVRIQQHTCSEIDHINHCREFLLQNFPKDQPEGSFANPVIVEDMKKKRSRFFNGVKKIGRS